MATGQHGYSTTHHGGQSGSKGAPGRLCVASIFLMTSTKRIAIVGGGVAGLVAAVALAQDGQDVHVYERQATFSPTSNGAISLSINGDGVFRGR